MLVLVLVLVCVCVCVCVLGGGGGGGGEGKLLLKKRWSIFFGFFSSEKKGKYFHVKWCIIHTKD